MLENLSFSLFGYLETYCSLWISFFLPSVSHQLLSIRVSGSLKVEMRKKEKEMPGTFKRKVRVAYLKCLKGAAPTKSKIFVVFKERENILISLKRRKGERKKWM